MDFMLSVYEPVILKAYRLLRGDSMSLIIIFISIKNKYFIWKKPIDSTTEMICWPRFMFGIVDGLQSGRWGTDKLSARLATTTR